MQCPFHGIIIPRDEHGNPVQSSNTNRQRQVEPISDIQSSSEEAGELWRDLQMQSDILAAAKVDSQPDAGGTKKRKGKCSSMHDCISSWSLVYTDTFGTA